MKFRLLLLCTALALAACQTMPGTVEIDGQQYKRGGDFPYGSEVAGKEGFVTSPHAENSALIDVRGFPRGTQVTDPWTGKIFLVP